MASGGDKKVTGEFSFNSLNDPSAFRSKSFSDRTEDEMDVFAETAVYDFSFSKQENLLPLMNLYKSEQESYNQLLKKQNENSNLNLHVELQNKKRTLEFMSHAITKAAAKDPCFVSRSIEEKDSQKQVPSLVREIKKEPEDS